MRITMQSKLIKNAINVRINAGQDIITIDDVVNDLASTHTFASVPSIAMFVKTFKAYAKTVNYTFMSDRIVRSSKFIGV